MGRRKKSSTEYPSFDQSEYYVKMEIEIQALRGKNKVLAQSVAKIQQEKAALQKQITSLQEEYFKLNSKYVNLKNIFVTIDSSAKTCFPKMADAVNHMAKIMHLCSIGYAVSGLDKDPKTLTVKPHTVNGMVIQNPTITLSRFNDLETSRANSINSNSPSSAQNNISRITSPTRHSRNQSYVPDPRPSTSRGVEENQFSLRSSLDQIIGENEDHERMEFVNRRHSRENVSNLRRRYVMEEDTENDNSLNLDKEEDEEVSEENAENEDSDYCQRLMTIEEVDEIESIGSPAPYTDHIREIRIYLSPLGNEQINKQNTNDISFVARSSSLSGEPSNSILDENATIMNDTHGSPNSSVRFINRTLENISIQSSSVPEIFSHDLSDSIIKRKTRPPQRLRSSGDDLPNDTCLQNKSESVANVEKSELSDGSVLEKSLNTILEDQSLEQTTRRSNSIATSTPIVPLRTPKASISKRKMSSKNSIENSSPVSSNITKRKGSGEKTAQVLIKRMSLNKSTTPAKAINETLDIKPITDVKQIKQRKSVKRNTKSVGKRVKVEPVDVDDKQNSKEMLVDKKKGKENIKRSRTSAQIPISSPRPKRSSKMCVYKEPSLNRKLRRSR